MTRVLLISFWLFSAAVVVASSFLLGYFGWAAILIWTVLVLPCTLALRKQRNDQWPSQTIRRLWAIAVISTLAGNIPPFIFSFLTLPEVIGRPIGWILICLIWSGLVASLAVVISVTSTAIRHSTDHRPTTA